MWHATSDYYASPQLRPDYIAPFVTFADPAVETAYRADLAATRAAYNAGELTRGDALSAMASAAVRWRTFARCEHCGVRHSADTPVGYLSDRGFLRCCRNPYACQDRQVVNPLIGKRR